MHLLLESAGPNNGFQRTVLALRARPAAEPGRWAFMENTPGDDARSAHIRFRPVILSAVITLLAACSTTATLDAVGTSKSPSSHSQVAKELVTFKSGELLLSGFLYKPDGKGPFPAVIWNHGSERNPDLGPHLDGIASLFVPAGYVVFAPMRRGHGRSEGRYIVDVIAQARATGGTEAANHLVVQLLESEQLDDQMAGLAYVKQLPFVDPARMAVGGWSYGGIQALLGAEREASYKAAISISPAALSWDDNQPLQRRLVLSIQRIRIPVLLLQPARDASLEPSRVLGAESSRLGKSLISKVYPATGPDDEQRHGFGGAKGIHVWAEDAKRFLEENLH